MVRAIFGGQRLRRSIMPDVDVQIPSKAVSDAEDVRKPTRDLLEDLYLLGSKADYDKAGDFTAIFKSPPQSVALIESGATTASKYWAAGLGAAVLLMWGYIRKWWPNEHDSVRVAAIASAGFVTAIFAVAVSYLFASDVRGRALAAVATVEARARVAVEMIEAAKAVFKGATGPSSGQLIPLPAGVKARNSGEPASNEKGWLAVAIELQPDGKRKYVLVKGNSEKVVDASDVDFD
jgi:hypothetical protein